MIDLNAYLPQAEQAADVIDSLMLDELHLAAPAMYTLSAKDERIYLIGTYDPMYMGRSLRVYEHPDIARRLRMALGLPVVITQRTGTHYVVLLHGKVALPSRVEFPGPASAGKPDIFRLGVGLRGEVTISAQRMLNALIGAAQGSGKSTLLHLLVTQMQAWGWRLYLADSQMHTFNPDAWNGRAAMSVAGSHADMLHVIDALESELANRQMAFRTVATTCHKIPSDLDDYNRLNAVHGRGLLPRLALVGDEFNFFMGHKPIFTRLAELLRAGRKWGLHIVVAAHEWHKETVPATVNDLFPTRIALHSLSGAVVLRDSGWGRWVEGRAPGRGVLKSGGRYEPLQFYRVEDVPAAEGAGPASLIPDREAELVRRSLAETDGKMTETLLTGWGMSQRDARDLATRYEACGWLVKDPLRDNAKCVTDELLAILGESRTNARTARTHEPFYENARTDARTARTGISPAIDAP